MVVVAVEEFLQASSSSESVIPSLSSSISALSRIPSPSLSKKFCSARALILNWYEASSVSLFVIVTMLVFVPIVKELNCIVNVVEPVEATTGVE